MPLYEFSHAIHRARRSGHNRFAREISVNIGREGARTLVPALSLLLERFHDNPVKFSTKQRAEPSWIGTIWRGSAGKRVGGRREASRGLRWVHFADDPSHFVKRCGSEIL